MNVWKAWTSLLVSQEIRTVTIAEPWWYPGVAFLTGLLAAIAGLLAVRGAFLGNEVVHYSDLAIMSQNRATDVWGQYEAESLKAHLAKTVAIATTNPTAVAALKAEESEYRQRQPDLKAKAFQFESDRDKWTDLSNKQVKYRDGLTLAGVIIQLAIGLASIAAMTKRRPAFVMSLVISAVGLTITAMAYINQFLHR